jgi:hypothetical protein
MDMIVRVKEGDDQMTVDEMGDALTMLRRAGIGPDTVLHAVTVDGKLVGVGAEFDLKPVGEPADF